MKIEPRNIRRTLKYAAVGICLVSATTAVGCEKDVQLDGDIAPAYTSPAEATTPTAVPSEATAPSPTPTVYLAGDIPAPEVQ